MFEGVPSYPEYGRFWQVVEKYKVTKFYTAPTAIRALAKEGTTFVEAHDISSLTLLGSVGEPINLEAWRWYHHYIGKDRCPIIDTWWQTETGGHMLTPAARGCTHQAGLLRLSLFRRGPRDPRRCGRGGQIPG